MLLLKYVHNGFLEDNKDSKIKSMFLFLYLRMSKNVFICT